MFHVRATRPKVLNDSRSPEEVYVCWRCSLFLQTGFLAIDNPPEPVSKQEANLLLWQCKETLGRVYDLNLRIVPATYGYIRLHSKLTRREGSVNYPIANPAEKVAQLNSSILWGSQCM
jgi:hypothetical protein